jgi:hypothetical protein
MSDFAVKENSGSLFRNERKDAAHPKWPDYSGTARVAGVDYWISGWVKTTKTGGKKYFSLTLKPKEVKIEDSPIDAPVNKPVDDGEMPF